VDAPRGSPASLTAPTVTGEYELRYVQGGKLVLVLVLVLALARRAMRVTASGIEEAH
jgi:hypothetical protein